MLHYLRMWYPTARMTIMGYPRDDRLVGDDQPPAVWFGYSTDRKAKWPTEHLQGYEGIVRVDGYCRVMRQSLKPAV